MDTPDALPSASPPPGSGPGTQTRRLRALPSRDPEYLLPERALARRLRSRFEERLRQNYPELAAQIDLSASSADWVVQCKAAGRGRSALRYLAAYVSKSAFNESRLDGYDENGLIRLRYKDSADNRWKIETIEPTELIRRWLLHVLPRGLVRIRHYGWLSPAAGKRSAESASCSVWGPSAPARSLRTRFDARVARRHCISRDASPRCAARHLAVRSSRLHERKL